MWSLIKAVGRRPRSALLPRHESPYIFNRCNCLRRKTRSDSTVAPLVTANCTIVCAVPGWRSNVIERQVFIDSAVRDETKHSTTDRVNIVNATKNKQRPRVHLLDACGSIGPCDQLSTVYFNRWLCGWSSNYLGAYRAELFRSYSPPGNRTEQCLHGT